MAKPDREPAKAQTHGGPFQDHRGGVETKEGKLFSPLLILCPYPEVTTNEWRTALIPIKL